MKIAAYLLLMVFATGAAAQTPAGSVDYDANDNNLIDVRTSTQLQAITHDLTGVGNAAGSRLWHRVSRRRARHGLCHHLHRL